MEASQKCFLALSLQQREGRLVQGGGFLSPNTLRGVLMCQLIFSDSCRGRLSKRKNPTICLPLFVHISYSILAHAYQIQITFFKPAKQFDNQELSFKQCIITLMLSMPTNSFKRQGLVLPFGWSQFVDFLCKTCASNIPLCNLATQVNAPFRESYFRFLSLDPPATA